MNGSNNITRTFVVSASIDVVRDVSQGSVLRPYRQVVCHPASLVGLLQRHSQLHFTILRVSAVASANYNYKITTIHGDYRKRKRPITRPSVTSVIQNARCRPIVA